MSGDKTSKNVSFYINKTSILELMPKPVKPKHFRTKADKNELNNYIVCSLYN